MRKIKLLSLVLFLFVAATGCKYEEGPLISFIPKTERITNTWKVSSATIDGVADDLASYKTLTFYKEGGFKAIFEIASIEFAYNGTWAFNDDKSGIDIVSTEELLGLTSYDRSYTILHLKEDELHVTWTEDSGNDLYDVVFVTN